MDIHCSNSYNILHNALLQFLSFVKRSTPNINYYVAIKTLQDCHHTWKINEIHVLAVLHQTPKYTIFKIQNTHMNKLENTAHYFSTLNGSKLVDLLLYSHKFNSKDNQGIQMLSRRLIKNSHRFDDQPLLCLQRLFYLADPSSIQSLREFVLNLLVVRGFTLISRILG